MNMVMEIFTDDINHRRKRYIHPVEDRYQDIFAHCNHDKYNCGYHDEWEDVKLMLGHHGVTDFSYIDNSKKDK